MKKLISICLAVIISNLIFANDIVTLTNQNSFEGKVTKIKNCEIHFKSEKDKYVIPASDIMVIQFESKENKVYKNYLKKLATMDGSACLKGTTDAKEFHGKEVKHVIFGFLFGVFGVIGAAVSKPIPQKGNDMAQSQNRDLMNNFDYLDCYKRSARKKNTAMSGIGFGAWILLYLALNSGN